MKRALVLGGGGARGAFQVGMLEELIVQQKLDFQIIRGVSVGALNAAFLAQASTAGNSQEALAEKVQELKEIWLTEISGNKSVFKRRLGYLGVVLGKNSLYSLEPLRNLIERRLSLEALRTSGRNFAVGTCSLVSGRYAEWRPDHPRFVDKLVASASIPVVFPFVDFPEEQHVLVDGGVRNITPLSTTLREKPDETYVLLTSRVIRTDRQLPDSAVEEFDYQFWQDNRLGTRVSGVDVLERIIEILSDEIYLEDIRAALQWNRLADLVQEVEKALEKIAKIPLPLSRAVEALRAYLDRLMRRFIHIYVLAPRRWFNEDAEPGKKNLATDFDPVLIEKAIEHGREVARQRDKWVWPPV